MKVSLFYLPSVGSKADIEKGRVGLQGHLYDQMLHDITAQARLADDLGYDSISFTEHHFHVEGFEVSNNPVMLDLYIAMQTNACASASSESSCPLKIRFASLKTSRCLIT